MKDSLAALDMLKHRGPDGFGYEYGKFLKNTCTVHHNCTPDEHCESSPDYFLGHRRLSIVDLNENAFQPMESSCKRFSVTFNGEIYNYVELKRELLALGCHFNTDHSDTEVLLNAFMTWGIECLEKLVGMFAFAIYDRRDNRLYIARDRIGQKTVYYEMTDSHFTFASELPPIVKFGDRRSISPIALHLYLLLGYIPYPYAIFQGVRKLPPATYAVVDLKRKSIDMHEYWDIDSQVDDQIDGVSAIELARNALRDSVKYRLRADVSIAAFISGGVDSTLIIKNISELSHNRFDTYGADFPNTDRSEKYYIVKAASRYGQNLKLSEIDASHIEDIEDTLNVFDEPFDGASSIALFDLFKEVGKDHKIVLTGDGGDEMFAGYERYISFPKRDAFIKVLRKLIFPKVILAVSDQLGILPRKFRTLKTLIDGDTFSNFAGLNDRQPFIELLKPKYRIENANQEEVFSDIGARIIRKGLSTVKALQYFELKTILPGRMLYKLDRMSMYYGVEARSPFLDHRLVEKAFCIPDDVNITKGITKSVLKGLLSPDFDDEFVHREKQGFGNPLTNWFRKSSEETIFAILANGNSQIFQFLDFDATSKRVDELRYGKDGLQEKSIWRLLVLAHYLENYGDFIAISR